MAAAGATRGILRHRGSKAQHRSFDEALDSILSETRRALWHECVCVLTSAPCSCGDRDAHEDARVGAQPVDWVRRASGRSANSSVCFDLAEAPTGAAGAAGDAAADVSGEDVPGETWVSSGGEGLCSPQRSPSSSECGIQAESASAPAPKAEAKDGQRARHRHSVETPSGNAYASDGTAESDPPPAPRFAVFYGRRSGTGTSGGRTLTSWFSATSAMSRVSSWKSHIHAAQQSKLTGIIQAATKTSFKEPSTTRRHCLRWRCGLDKGMCLDVVMGIVILLNAATIGLSLDLSPQWVGWQVLDGVFAAFFAVEIFIKMWSLGVRDFLRGESRWWHLYDCAMVLSSVAEMLLNLVNNRSLGADDGSSPYSTGVLRVVRLTRVVRLLRVMKLPFFSDLVMMINGAVGGVRTLIWSQILLAAPLYGFAVTLREWLGPMSSQGQGAEMFGSMSSSFFTCFRCLVAGDCVLSDGRPLVLTVSTTYGASFMVAYLFAFAFMTFGLSNVIASIFVDNILVAAKLNHLRMKQIRLSDQRMFAEKAMALIELVWREQGKAGQLPFTEGDGPEKWTNLELDDLMRIRLTPQFFDELRNMRAFQDILRDLDISPEEQCDLFDTLDVDGGGTIDLDELIRGIMKLRGDARRSDIVSVGLMVRHLQQSMEALERHTQRSQSAQKETLTMLRAVSALSERSGARRGGSNPSTPRSGRAVAAGDDAAGDGAWSRASSPGGAPGHGDGRRGGAPGDGVEYGAGSPGGVPRDSAWPPGVVLMPSCTSPCSMLLDCGAVPPAPGDAATSPGAPPTSPGRRSAPAAPSGPGLALPPAPSAVPMCGG